MSLLANNGKALILAMDHAIVHGKIAGLEDPGQVIDAAVEAGADAVMTTFGIIKRYRHQLIGRIPTIMRLDSGPSLLSQDWMAYTEYSQQFEVEDALLLGADGVVTNMFVGIPVELETFQMVARVAGDCLRLNMPFMVEALPCPGEVVREPMSGHAMAIAARLAFERGADYVKSYYTGDIDDFRQVVENCPVPVLIAGGPKMDTLRGALQVVYDSLQAGAAGVVFGRNIWQSSDPQGMIRALRHIIHDNGSVNEALAALEGS
ncbi:MAG TPA: fructose-bisphosphate aldolase [Anaerolineae bacterium]|nr:fructose-bisphosphate aldolase [Anaerolineae bacterium]HMR68267.1 fructose-bisphosphate aldolase [Anaerolineae bacterium]